MRFFRVNLICRCTRLNLDPKVFLKSFAQTMKKFCFYFPLVESGIVVGVSGAIVWLLYFIHALVARNVNCKSVDKRKHEK